MTGPVLPDQYMGDLRALAARARLSPAVATTLMLHNIDRALARARTLELLEQRSRLAWTWETTHRAPRDIPDLLPNGTWPQCGAKLPLSAWATSRYPCARRDGHTGRHAAGNGTKIVAVWSDRHESALMVCAALEDPDDLAEHPARARRRGTAADA